MSLTLAKADELVALTTKLAALIEGDIATLKAKRPALLAEGEADRATLLLQYGKAAAEFKTPATLAALPLATKQRLKAAAERLHKAIKEQNRLLARFRHVSEGLIKAIAETVAAREAPSLYAKSGAYAKPQGARPTAFAFNQSV